MAQHIVFSNEDGSVAICTPTGLIPVAEVLTKDVPAGKGAMIVDESFIPMHMADFEPAWELTPKGIIVNMDKAKEHTKKRLRRDRTDKLQALDVAFQRALETGADTKAIVAEKNRLRDITNKADAVSTLEELRKISI